MSRKSKTYFVITPYYLNHNMYILKKAYVTENKRGNKIWKTKLYFGPTCLKQMLIDRGKKLAKENKTRLLVGIKNNQAYKKSDIYKEVAKNELR